MRRKLATLGVAVVRTRLESGAYAANMVPIVRAWLDEQSIESAHGQRDKAKSLTDIYIEKLKNRPVIAVVLIAVAVVVGLAQLTDAISKLKTALPEVFRPAVALPTIPGDSGWLLLGDLDPDGKRYVRGPLYETEKSAYPDKSLTPRKGELLRLSAERNVVIAGYKNTGLAQKFTPPWQLNALSDPDYTGVKLPRGSVVEVRDVSLGRFPGQPIVVWARVAPPPK